MKTVLFLLAAIILAACERNSPAEDRDDLMAARRDSMERAAQRAKDSLDRIRDEYFAEIDTRMARLDERYDTLEQQYSRAKGKNRVEIEQKIQRVRTLRENLRTKYSSLRSTNRSNYESARRSFDSVWREVQVMLPESPRQQSSNRVILAPNRNPDPRERPPANVQEGKRRIDWGPNRNE